jgi:hypothetical protein
MTQDQYGQARGPGYVARGDAVPDDETEGYTEQEGKPMTRFQRVASALRGDRADQVEADQVEADQDGPVRNRAQDPDAAGANSPWVTEQDQAVAVTRPDARDHPATEPDLLGTTTHTGNGATSAPYAESQAGAATIADVPAAGTAGTSVPADAATGTSGRHAAAPEAAARATGELRPGEATGALGDFSDLTYGNLVPDAGQYTAQWQQIQFRFVDDPHGSVTEAAYIVAQVTAKMEAAIQERQRAIETRQRAIAEQQRTLRGRWGEDANADTETLRETLRMYKAFLDQLIGSRAS